MNELREAVTGHTERGVVTHALRPFDPEEPDWRRTLCGNDPIRKDGLDEYWQVSCYRCSDMEWNRHET